MRPQKLPVPADSAPRTTLLAVSGMSPAILTETVWALAAEKVVPTEVVVVTTSEGAKRLSRDLLEPRSDWAGKSVWESLRGRVLGRKAAASPLLQLTRPRVIELPDLERGVGRPADDIRSADDNAAAADFILEQVRSIVENPETRLVASIAGGRKTMGALLYAAMTLLGRESDRVTHVLVSEPFDACRGFFFPGQPVQTVTAGNGSAARLVNVSKARVELADIPFVPLRNRFEDLGSKPGSFQSLVQRYSIDFKAEASRPVRVSLDFVGKVLHIDGTPVPMRVKAQWILRFLIESGRLRDQIDAANRFPDWREKLSDDASCPKSISTEDIRRELFYLKDKATKAGCRWPVAPRHLDFTCFEIA